MPLLYEIESHEKIKSASEMETKNFTFPFNKLIKLNNLESF